MIDILNLTFPELERFIVEDLGQPKFRAAQVWQWIWQKHATSFDAMTDVSKQLRAKLAEIAEIVLPEIVTVQTSSDGTEKLLLRLRDGALVETVILPSTGQDGSVRIAQCVSSQIGCAMGCTFCSTGTMGFIRNMTAGEILSQVLVARMRLGDNRIDHPIIRNLVFMGMGEPLLNLRETTRALEMLNHDKGMDFSPRRITVSTCGIKAGLRELGDSGLAFLAVSLHAPNQELRAKIMPKAANWHLDDLMATLESYPLKTREHITFEYLLLGGVNDQPEHARELGLVVKLHDEPGVDEDGTARHGEGVHAVVQQHVGGEREGLRGEGFGEAVHNGLDVALDFGVFHKRHTGADEHVELASEFFFVLDAETAEKRGLRRDRALQEQGE